MGMDKFKAGDVIQYPDGRQDYLIEIPGEDGLWVNACNTSWIDRGLRGFGEECYPFGSSEDMEAEVVGHYGDGDGTSAQRWYEENRERYRPERYQAHPSVSQERDDMTHAAEQLNGRGGSIGHSRER